MSISVSKSGKEHLVIFKALTDIMCYWETGAFHVLASVGVKFYKVDVRSSKVCINYLIWISPPL